MRKASRKEKLIRIFQDQWFLLLCTVPFIVYIFIFSFYPIYSWKWAFYDYQPGAIVQEFVGFEKFAMMFRDSDFWRALKNTVIISLLMLTVSTICAVAFAVFLNELPKGGFKKFTQTVSYLPHFVSWTVIAALYKTLLKSDGGVINNLLLNLNLIKEPIDFMYTPSWYYVLITLFSVWKETGWNAIIYLSAMTAINSELYEAARVDGAGRFTCMWHITLPSIRSTIVILTVMNIGWLLGAGFEQGLLLGNNKVISNADVLGTYIYRRSLGNANSPDFGLSIAAGAFQSLISILLLVSVNFASKKLSDTSIL